MKTIICTNIKFSKNEVRKYIIDIITHYVKVLNKNCKMCGITCILSTNQSANFSLFEAFKENIVRRGPDFLDVKTYSYEKFNILFAGSVLWLQGKCITKQPVEDDHAVLIYNGDIFGGIPEVLREEKGDTLCLFDILKNANSILVALSKIQGPYAFIYLDKINQKLYFSRDIYGRRSLLIGRNNTALVLTSVTKKTEGNFIELPSIGLFVLDLNTNKFYIMPWQKPNQNFLVKLSELNTFLNEDIIIKEEMIESEDFRFIDPTTDDLQLLKKLKKCDTTKSFEILLNNPEWLKRVLKLESLLTDAIKKRITTQPKYCKYCIKEKITCNHSLVGVLFSGGIDCAILALLADKFVDKDRPIDLINVAFDEVNNYQTPDRLTSLSTLSELRKICPERNWNFLEINVPQEELDKERKQHIADLIFPLQSILDDSLGCALWFASRAKLESSVSPCRILLVGMGADELFGGYTKHRAALNKDSWIGLYRILKADWENIPYRNLARDDRVVSDHGRQLRTPYLDENVVEFVRGLNCWEKTYPSNDVQHGLGEKILLRSLGYYIGLKNAAIFKKKALQFGSKIANKKENAYEISPRLL